MRNAGLDKAQTGIKIARRNISNLRYADDTTLMLESKEELKSLLMKVKDHPWVGKILWRRNGNPLQYFCLENSMDREAW